MWAEEGSLKWCKLVVCAIYALYSTLFITLPGWWNQSKRERERKKKRAQILLQDTSTAKATSEGFKYSACFHNIACVTSPFCKQQSKHIFRRTTFPSSNQRHVMRYFLSLFFTLPMCQFMVSDVHCRLEGGKRIGAKQRLIGYFLCKCLNSKKGGG